MSKKSKRTFSVKSYLPTIIAFAVIALMICFMLVIVTYVTGLDTSYEENAVALSADAVDVLNRRIEDVILDAQIALYRSRTYYGDDMESFLYDYNIEVIQAINGNYVIDEWGNNLFAIAGDEIHDLIDGMDEYRSTVFTSASLSAKCLAIYIPVSEFEGQSGLMIYFRLDTFIRDALFKNGVPEELKYGCLMKKNGGTISIFAESDEISEVGNDFYSYVYDASMNKVYVDDIKSAVSSSETGNGFGEYLVDGISYTASFCKIPAFTSDLYVLLVEHESALDSGSKTVYNTFTIYAVAMLVFCFVLTVWAMLLFRKAQNDPNEGSADAQIGSKSYYRFEREAKTTLQSNFYQRYAIIYLDINKFEFIKDNFDPALSRNVLTLVAKMIAKIARRGETYGHVIDNRFVILLTYNKNEEVINRLKVINALVNANTNVRQNNLNLRLNVGIYYIEDKNMPLQDIISRAIIAQTIPKRHSGDFYAVYDEKVRENYSREAKVEAIMEYSLKNREFCLFFQPKYDVEKDRSNGAEVLVRWYNKKKNYYEQPDNFIPLFEANGFITNLDKFVFVEACRFLSDGVREGRRTIPLSVNVSRVTAIQPDFTEYYIKTKKAFGIANGFICLEFTESFAYENYDVVRKIISDLQKEGFKTSIDDFGCGYSSFNMLKEISVDELKLDRFFIKKGETPDRDEVLIKAAIKLAKDLGMHVTQEGVEAPEDMIRLREYGCDTIQGYCYAHPMMLSDFITFLNNDTSYRGVHGVGLQ